MQMEEMPMGVLRLGCMFFYAYISLPLFMTPTKQFFIYYYQIIILSNDIILV